MDSDTLRSVCVVICWSVCLNVRVDVLRKPLTVVSVSANSPSELAVLDLVSAF